MVSVSDDVGLRILSVALFLLLVGIAVRIAWARFGPGFRNRYGPERGPHSSCSSCSLSQRSSWHISPRAGGVVMR